MARKARFLPLALLALSILLNFFHPLACINTSLAIFSNESALARQYNDFLFEGVDVSDEKMVKDLLKFNPGSEKFWTIASVLLNNINMNLALTDGYNFPKNCDRLPLDKSQRYVVVYPIDANATFPFNSFDIKMPFNEIIASGNQMLGQNFCIAFNKKNYGIALSAIIPCMRDIGDCGLEITGVSLSVEGKLFNSNTNSVTVFDGLRPQSISSFGHFAVQTKIKMPIGRTLEYYPIDQTGKKGFHVTTFNSFMLMGQFKRENLFYLDSDTSKVDLFLNGIGMFSVRLNTSSTINGMLIDSVTNALGTCFPSGIYFSTRTSGQGQIAWDSGWFVSFLLRGLLGNGRFRFNMAVDAGYYIDFRKSRQNGFFIRAEASVISMFNLFSVKADIEIQKVNMNELRRRKQSFLESSYCSDDYEITPVSRFLFDTFYQTYKTVEENPFHLDNSTGKFLNLQFGSDLPYYFVGFLRTKAKLGFWLLVKLIKLNGIIEGVFVSPNPYKPGHTHHIELVVKASLVSLFVHILDVDLKWLVDDVRTTWYFEGTLLGLLEVDVKLIGSSDWLQERGIGGLLSSKKSLDKWKVKFNPLYLNQILNAVTQGVKWVAKKLDQTIKEITAIISGIRDEVKKVTDKFCFYRSCLLSDILSSFISSVFGGALGSILSVFGSTKTSINYNVGINKYKCPIHEKVTKKCAFGKCKVIRRERFDDPSCMDRVRKEMLDAKHQEELANYKEEILVFNMEGNQGLLWVIDEMDNGRDFLSLEELEVQAITWETSKRLFDDYDAYERASEQKNRNFDPDDESFFTNWENDLNDMDIIEENDDEIDVSQIYEIPESEKEVYQTELKIKIPRLAKTFRGKESQKAEVGIPLTLNIHDPDQFEGAMNELRQKLIDPDGVLVKAFLGDNLGVTEDLLDALNMRPPEISLKTATRQTIYCDDSAIDRHYGSDDQMVIEMMRSYLTPTKLEYIFKRCNQNIQYDDFAQCRDDDEICGATLCNYERSIIDGCNQRSNVVYQEIRILPRKPRFMEFPANFYFSCNDDVEVKEEESRFRLPETHTGCRNVLVDILYNDTLSDGAKCKETIYRDWRVEVMGCEDSLYETKTQKIFVEDTQAPVFGSFPADKQVDFMDAYGTNELGYPTIYDACGHGPSKLNYEDKLFETSDGTRKLERTWTAQDVCGNKRSRAQRIEIRNKRAEPNENDFRNFNIYSEHVKSVNNSEIEGRVFSKLDISLANSSIGEELEDAVGDQLRTKCFSKKPKYVLMSEGEIRMRNASVNGPSISFFGQKPTDFPMNPVDLSKFLNRSMTGLNIGPKRFVCLENNLDSRKRYPISNYLGSTCQTSEFKDHFTNVIDPEAIKFLVIDENENGGLFNLNMKGNELVYNTFYLNNLKLLNRLNEFNIDIPKGSIAIINIDLDNEDSQQSKFVSPLSISNIDKPEHVVFNFVNPNVKRIEFDSRRGDKAVIYGTILAPHSEVSFTKDILHYGQLISQNAELNNYKQICNQLDLFKYT